MWEDFDEVCKMLLPWEMDGSNEVPEWFKNLSSDRQYVWRKVEYLKKKYNCPSDVDEVGEFICEYDGPITITYPEWLEELSVEEQWLWCQNELFCPKYKVKKKENADETEK